MIVHLDADAFFASVEQAADPRLRGRMVAVGGEKRGIIASASYEARACGVYTPMPTARARKLCPKLIVLPGDFEKYERFSRWMFSYAYDFTPRVEVTSIDEGYFDVKGHRKSPVEIADLIRRAIGQALRISVSEGVGSNKLVSQIASKLNKPKGFFSVPAGKEIRFLHPLPNHWLPGVGPKTAQRLTAAGLARVRHIAETPVELLSVLVGGQAIQLRQYAHGVDQRPVMPAREAAKSYGQQETFGEDQTDEDFVAAVLRGMADRLMARVREDGKSVRTLTVKARYNDMAEDQCGESLPEPTDLESDLYPRLGPLLRRAWKRRVSLRLVSLRLTNVYDGCFRSELPLDAAARRRDARRRLAASLDELRKAHGAGVVFRGHDFTIREQEERRRNLEESEPARYPAASEGVPRVLREESEVYRLNVRAPERAAAGGAASGFARVRSGESGRGARPVVRGGLAPFLAAVAALADTQSYYSFLDSTLSVDSIVALARRERLPAISLTDWGNLHGAVPFVQAARAAGIKPLLGAALNIEGRRVRILVENREGYGNLCRILSELNDEQGLARDGVWRASTAGLVAIGSDPDMAPLFPGAYYGAVSHPGELRRWARCDLPVVASVPVRYARPADRWKYDVVQSIRTLTLLRQAHPGKRLDGGFHFRSRREWETLFGGQGRVLRWSQELMERCTFELNFGAPQFPAFKPPDGWTARGYLRRLVLDGAGRRYPGCLSKVLPQLERELAIIAEVGYEEYFLVMWDVLQACRRRGIEWITRGSAADSLVCYCLEISGVCPLRFDLYFRRFLNKERMALNKLPDIDVDFAHDRKDDVVDLIFEKYGSSHAAVVGGFSTYHARSALGDVAKVLGISEHQIRQLTKRLPHARAEHLSAVVATSRECADQPFEEEPYKSAVVMASFLDGFPRYRKMHPCGLVLSCQPMHELVPTFVSQKGYPTTHFDMDAVEAIGLVKMDILAQGGLAVMRDVVAGIRARGAERGEGGQWMFPWNRAGSDTSCSGAPSDAASGEEASTLDTGGAVEGAVGALSRLEPWDDPEVWEMIAGGGARAVHHIESPAMVSLCRMCNVRDIDTLIAIVSVIRPGAANESKKMDFARRYQGLAAVTYPHPSLEPCLKSTFGLVVYEEHILQICELFAGLPGGRADVLRRALGKEKEDLIDEIRKEFVASARRRGREPEAIEDVWELVAGFRGYAFCKAHSTAYGVEAYEAAWLKRYYPAPFMAAVLSHGKGFYSPLVYVLECHRLHIRLLVPSVNDPGPAFAVRSEAGPAIRVPATRIKGLTERVRCRMVDERARGEFRSMTDFYRRVQPSPEEMESLLRVGAFDLFGKSRAAQFWECQSLRLSEANGAAPDQGWLFPPLGSDRVPDTDLEEPTWRQRLIWESDLLGFCVSGHPLDLYADVDWKSYCPVAELGRHLGRRVVTCGLVIEQRLHHQVTGEVMKFLTLADWTGMVETELFASTYRNYGLATVRYPVLEVAATVEPFENGNGFSLRVHRAGKARTLG